MRRMLIVPAPSPLPLSGISTPTLSATATGTTTIALQANYTPLPNTSSYTFQFTTSLAIVPTTLITQVGQSYIHRGLTPNTTYYYRMNVQTDDGRNSVWSLYQSATTQTPVISTVLYPMLQAGYGSFSQNYSNAAFIPEAAHFDHVMISGDYERGAQDHGYNRETVVVAVQAGDGVVLPAVSQYNICDHWDTTSGSSPSPSSTPNWGLQLNAMTGTWFLWASGSSGTHVENQFHPAPTTTDWQTNSCLLAGGLDANGNGLEAAFAQYQYDNYINGGTANNSPSIKSQLHDNFITPYQRPSGDYLHTGSQSGGTPAVISAWIAGQAKWIQKWRTLKPTMLLGANCDFQFIRQGDGTTRFFQLPTSTLGALYQTMDFTMNEGILGLSNSPEHYGGPIFAVSLIQYHEAVVLHPEYNFFVHYGVDANGKDMDRSTSNGQALRYGHTMCLVTSSGCYGAWNTTVSQAGGAFNFQPKSDYYAVNASGVSVNWNTASSATIAASRKWLGTPTDAIQTAASVGKLWVRTFLNSTTGITYKVIWNPGNTNGQNPSAAAVTFNPGTTWGGTWKYITASGGNTGSNAAVDTGAAIAGNITVPIADGLILIKTS